jgi:pimeloyl-ACP methyl ester carboxylesterase
MAAKADFIICARYQDKDGAYQPAPGPTRFLRVARTANDYSTAKVLKRDQWRTAVADAADGDEDEITGMTGDVLVFVHGYNNDIPIVLWRTRTLQDTLAKAGWKGLVVGFDWPSDNSTLNYHEDRWDASAVALGIVTDAIQLLVEAQDPAKNQGKACTINVHLLGHSTGAYVIMDAFAQAQKRGDLFKSDWRIGQVAFIGADVASSSLCDDSEWGRPMFGRIMRLTNYSNPYDKVLGVSNAKRLGTAPRAGRSGLPVPAAGKAINVDCGAYFLTKDPSTSVFQGTFNHSWHIGDPTFALDLAMTLEGSIDREAISTREKTPSGLRLRTETVSRPTYENRWDAKEPADMETLRR